MSVNITTLKIRALGLLAMCTVLSACGGSSGGGTQNIAPTVDDAALSDNTATDADISVEPQVNVDLQAFDAFASIQGTANLHVKVRLTNNGNAAVNVPRGILQVSMDPDGFSTGNYAHYDISLRSDDVIGWLQPGQSALYDASDSAGQGWVNLHIARFGTHYARVWINHDLSTRYENTGDQVETEYLIAELDHTNNISDVFTFEVNGTVNNIDHCAPDAYEENDTAELATKIVVDTEYVLNGCDESYDILSVDMIAGEVYGISQNEIWDLTLVDPNGTYIEKAEHYILHQAEITGEHLIIATRARTQTSEVILQVSQE